MVKDMLIIVFVPLYNSLAQNSNGPRQNQNLGIALGNEYQSSGIPELLHDKTYRRPREL
jgi:hypothetical protein